MSDTTEQLRKELLDLGVPAPKSWNDKKLASELELEKAKLVPKKKLDVTAELPAKTEPKIDVDSKKTSKKNDVKIKPAPLKEESNKSEDLVEVVAVADFSNERLDIKRMKPNETAKFSTADADFLVNVDRMCKYVK